MTDRAYRCVARVALGLFRALDLRLDIVGQQHIPATGGAVVVMNHTGYLDFALAGVPFWQAHRRLVRFMAKQEVFTHRVSGPLMRAMRHIPVDRAAGMASFRAAVEALRAGELVGVFPEATISRSFCLKEFKSGATRMALIAGVPLIPVTLWGSQRIWTKDRKPTIRAARHIPVGITIGPPLRPGRGADADAALIEVMNGLLDQTRARYPQAPGDDPWWVPAHLGGTAPTPERAAELDAAEQVDRTGRDQA
ncbi:MAG TPA: lysophospholipid acyltransferase family protein [Pseudonocardiaceae bacterium]|jgi:1-acyl-sn-glycerol-3-phosphate acyltransferase|nr:lysophospholipid acyltransferase family protein [Pseudonocardiaceae bacterium]